MFKARGSIETYHNHPDGDMSAVSAHIAPRLFNSFKEAHEYVMSFPNMKVVLSQQEVTQYYSAEIQAHFTVKEVN